MQLITDLIYLTCFGTNFECLNFIIEIFWSNSKIVFRAEFRRLGSIGGKSGRGNNRTLRGPFRLWVVSTAKRGMSSATRALPNRLLSLIKKNRGHVPFTCPLVVDKANAATPKGVRKAKTRRRQGRECQRQDPFLYTK